MFRTKSSPPPPPQDECSMEPNPCGSSRCINTVGSYQCGCPAGYQFDMGLSICVQSGGGGTGCASAPCAFGCSPGGPQVDNLEGGSSNFRLYFSKPFETALATKI